MSDIKAIVFDLGGVLFEEGKSVAAEKLFMEKNYDKDVVLGVLKSPKSIDLRMGLISDEEFWSFAQQHIPQRYDAKTIKKYWYDGYVLNRKMLDLVREFYGKYRLIIFSGNIRSKVEYLDKKYDFRRYFNLEIYSYDYRANKPSKEFIEILIEKSGMIPKEMAYIDDDEGVVKPAKELGINIIIYKNGDIRSLKDSLKLLGVS